MEKMAGISNPVKSHFLESCSNIFFTLTSVWDQTPLGRFWRPLEEQYRGTSSAKTDYCGARLGKKTGKKKRKGYRYLMKQQFNSKSFP